MKFQPGQPKPPNSGRKKGTPNKAKLREVAEILAEGGLHPVEEIIRLLMEGDMKDKERADLWMDLMSYCQAKPKEIETNPEETNEELEGLLDVTDTARLLQIVKAHEKG